MAVVQTNDGEATKEKGGNYDTLFNLYLRRNKGAVKFPDGPAILKSLQSEAEKHGYVWRQVETKVAGYVSYVVETTESAKTAGKASDAARIKAAAEKMGLTPEQAIAILEAQAAKSAPKK